MDVVWIVTILTNIVVGGMAYVLKTLYKELHDLRDAVQSTREQYVHKEDLRQMKEELTNRFDRLEDILINRKLKD